MFNKGKLYKRSELHDQYGGNRHGGIANCKHHPYIFIFTGSSGEAHGYEDGWDGDYFLYTGEGQSGDMEFTKGNKALLEHETNDKSVFLFENEGKGLWKFIDQLRLVDYKYIVTPDTSGLSRKAIQFKFVSTESLQKTSDYTLPEIDYNIPTVTERKGLVISRVGQGAYRKSLIEKWEGKCAVTGLDNSKVLIASHILAWKDSNNSERMDVDNGILLSPNLDALFDRHLISFENNGNIIFGKELSNEQFQLLGVTNDMQLRFVDSGMKKYLKRHRELLK